MVAFGVAQDTPKPELSFESSFEETKLDMNLHLDSPAPAENSRALQLISTEAATGSWIV